MACFCSRPLPIGCIRPDRKKRPEHRTIRISSNSFDSFSDPESRLAEGNRTRLSRFRRHDAREGNPRLQGARRSSGRHSTASSTGDEPNRASKRCGVVSVREPRESSTVGDPARGFAGFPELGDSPAGRTKEPSGAKSISSALLCRSGCRFPCRYRCLATDTWRGAAPTSNAQAARRADIPEDAAGSSGSAEIMAASAVSRVERYRAAVAACTAVDRAVVAVVGFAGTVGRARSERGQAADLFALQSRAAGALRAS